MEKSISLDQFHGPLDLLLQLIEGEQLQVTNIAIAEVTEQFLLYLDDIEETRPDELADFLVVATKLLLLKSYALLPYLQLDEEEDPNELEAQLKMYKKYVDGMKKIEAMVAQQNILFTRKATNQPLGFYPPEECETDQLRKAFVQVLERLEPVVKIPKSAVEKVMTMREKFCDIQKKLEKKITLGFQDLIADSKDRAEVVVTFLALLELIKRQSICVRQENPQSEITIEKVESEQEE